jgi:hypothetical protein
MSEVIAELRKGFSFGLYGKVTPQREAKWAVIQASKTEGASAKDLDIFNVGFNESVDDTISDLRSKGYRIFYLYKPIGIIDDNISVRNEIDVKKLAIKLSEDRTYN